MVGEARRIQGVVKPTAKAKQDFENSKKKNERGVAALLEEHTPKIFETSLGNVPGKTTVKVTLVYIQELEVVTSKEETSEGLAMMIPTSVAPRYDARNGSAPTTGIPNGELDIRIGVLDDGDINTDGCHVESHHPATCQGIQPVTHSQVANFAELRRLETASGHGQRREHVWRCSLGGSAVLKTDFVFFIQTREKSRLDSRALITPPNRLDHAALMISIRPNDIFGSAILPHEFKGEILFVLDQSESMGWTLSDSQRLKIDTMIGAMGLALASMPSTCSFNMLSFGSNVRILGLKVYKTGNKEHLSEARAYVAGLGAHMGGTDVLRALRSAVEQRNPSAPWTQIILITDGEVDEEDGHSIQQYVLKKRRELGEDIRFFTLGIGDDVSHSLVESIAHFCGGYCEIIDVAHKSGWEDRLIRILRSAMEPRRWTCHVHLGPGYERTSLAACPFGADAWPGKMVSYVQGPHPVPPLHPFKYKSIFCLLDLRNGQCPERVTIKPTADAAKKQEYRIKVEHVEPRRGTIHQLAAKAILRSLEDECTSPGTDADQARMNAETLGIKYTVSGKWTTFVAVADDDEEKTGSMHVSEPSWIQIPDEELMYPEEEDGAVDDGESRSSDASERDLADFTKLDRIDENQLVSKLQMVSNTDLARDEVVAEEAAAAESPQPVGRMASRILLEGEFCGG